MDGLMALVKISGGRGRMGGPLAAGPDGLCVCTSCGHTIPHVTGQPCSDMTCPACGGSMTRASTKSADDPGWQEGLASLWRYSKARPVYMGALGAGAGGLLGLLLGGSARGALIGAGLGGLTGYGAARIPWADLLESRQPAQQADHGPAGATGQLAWKRAR